MINSPPSATTDSSLYMHLPAVHISSYIARSAREYFLKRFVFVDDMNPVRQFGGDLECLLRRPDKKPVSASCPFTTRFRHRRSTGTISAARSTKPTHGRITQSDEHWHRNQCAPIQWNVLMISSPDIPGNRYLCPPEKPIASCGNVGPMISKRS